MLIAIANIIGIVIIGIASAILFPVAIYYFGKVFGNWYDYWNRKT